MSFRKNKCKWIPIGSWCICHDYKWRCDQWRSLAVLKAGLVLAELARTGRTGKSPVLRTGKATLEISCPVSGSPGQSANWREPSVGAVKVVRGLENMLRNWICSAWRSPRGIYLPSVTALRGFWRQWIQLLFRGAQWKGESLVTSCSKRNSPGTSCWPWKRLGWSRLLGGFVESPSSWIFNTW